MCHKQSVWMISRYVFSPFPPNRYLTCTLKAVNNQLQILYRGIHSLSTQKTFGLLYCLTTMRVFEGLGEALGSTRFINQRSEMNLNGGFVYADDEEHYHISS